MSKARLPLLNRTGWAFLAALGLVVAYLIIDRPIAQPETITGIVTHVYVSTPQYSTNAVHCRVQVRNDFYLDGSCAPAQVGARVNVCKSVRRFTGIEAYEIC
jgi:hypothetical protein